MRQPTHDSYEWTIVAVHEEAPHVRSLMLKAVHERPLFIAGQYLTVRLPHFEPAEGKSYSISSNENEELVRLTIKEIGAFSKSLFRLHVGDTLHTSAPYGFFYPEKDAARELVFIAGGIGITPCMSIIDTYCSQNYVGRVTLFYSNQRVAEAIFEKDLNTLSRTHTQLSVIHHITREIPQDAHYTIGRMSGKIIRAGIQNPLASDFFICGSIDFTKGIWKELRDVGIKNDQLYTEGFF